jgi:hypothetical protein
MPRRAALETLKPVAVHGLALAILLWPLAGIEYVPMVDLPGHLAITRVLDDFLHGKFRDTLQLNLDPIHKPTYALLYAVFAVLPKTLVGPVAVGLMIALCYAAVCHAIASLGRRPASSPLVASLAALVGMFCYGSTFFWGLIPFFLAMPPALIAWRAYLEASGVADPPRAGARTTSSALVFVAAAALAHVVHPLASLFLGIMLAGAAVAAIAFALGRRAAGGKTPAARVGAVVWPLVVWAFLVGTLQIVTAPSSYDEALADSAPALLAPFHGVAAARAFLAQIPVELGVVPTRERAATRVAYPVAVAVLLAASCVLALVGARLSRTRTNRSRENAPGDGGAPEARLAAAFVLSALLLLFLRHDLLQMGIRALFFPVRAPGFLVFFFAVLAAALLLRALERNRIATPLGLVVIVCALGLAMERSAVLRVHFVAFDRKAHAFFRGDIPDRYFQSQPFSYGDHIRVYNCYFDATCYDLSRLFFSIYADATIYPVSKRRTPPDADRSR